MMLGIRSIASPPKAGWTQDTALATAILNPTPRAAQFAVLYDIYDVTAGKRRGM